MTRTVTILGATGSIGRSTREVILSQNGRFRVEAVVGGRDAPALAETARALGVRFAALADPGAQAHLREELAGSGIASGAGAEAVTEAVDRDADIVVAAISGAAGLRPTVRALKPGRSIALANKETLVCAGEAFMAEARRVGATILAMDSEHNALAQALEAGRREDVVKLTITASGGPFRTWSAERIAAATPSEASAHPTYAMGAKINIDSATLMNKGLELIEAHHLFGVDPDRVDAVVHPQSIVHGLVTWRDGGVVAVLNHPDMRVPISHCLGEGSRLTLSARPLDLAAVGSLTFEPVDEARFPCFTLAKEALRDGGVMPTVLNAANEVAVSAFLAGTIRFPDIASVVERTCAASTGRTPASVEEALHLDGEARRRAEREVTHAARTGSP
jgi:1-deoxy-D-xylulose-5-phosphate reductoisomerase